MSRLKWAAVVLILAACPARGEMARIEAAAHIASERYGVDKTLILAVIQVESGFDPYAIGGIGEVGLMQLRPEMHECASFNILENVLCGTRYLATVKQRCKPKYGNLWFVCYNRGPNAPILNYPERFPYVAKVLQVKKNMQRVNFFH